jgi:hypothetical protein
MSVFNSSRIKHEAIDMIPREFTDRTDAMKPDVSLVIEWENVILAESQRSSRMLAQLGKQVRTLNRAAEVIVLFNTEQIEKSLLENELFNKLGLDENNSVFSLRVEDARGRHYYDLKNTGARLATGEIVVFLDSDVIPEEGWLVNLIDPFFSNNGIKILAGNSYLDCEGLYSKAFALGWFFSLQCEERHLGVHKAGFFANNVAFRKELIMTHPFPEMPEGVTRKSCVMLAKQLKHEGIPIWINTAAQVAHPAPNGFKHFFIRALAQGRDNFLFELPGLPLFLKGFYLKKIISTPLRIILSRRKVDLPLWQTPAAIGIMLTYYTTALAGAIITAVNPRYAKSSWKI